MVLRIVEKAPGTTNAGRSREIRTKSPPANKGPTEAQFQRQVIQLAHLLGWMSYHTHDSRRSAAGFPDLCLVRVRGGVPRLVFAELKTKKNKLSDEQRVWLTALVNTGAEAYEWRPEMWSDIRDLLTGDGP